jgi:hypothetical protein
LKEGDVEGAADADLLIEHDVKADYKRLPWTPPGETLTVQFVKQLKIVPPRRERSPDRGAGGCSPPCAGSDCCNCFTGHCLFEVRKAGGTIITEPRKMSDLRVGDVVATGAPSAEDAFRRITRIWPSAVPTKTADIVELAPGCYLTDNHPALKQGKWSPAGSLGRAEKQAVDIVYGIELEGHVDTVVGGVVCAALGVYCGPSFGWNIFTRRTTFCDSWPCAKCDVAVDTSIDFANIVPQDLDARYTPY